MGTFEVVNRLVGFIDILCWWMYHNPYPFCLFLPQLPVSNAEPKRIPNLSRTPLWKMELYQSAKSAMGMSSQTLYSLVKTWYVPIVVLQKILFALRFGKEYIDWRNDSPNPCNPLTRPCRSPIAFSNSCASMSKKPICYSSWEPPCK